MTVDQVFEVRADGRVYPIRTVTIGGNTVRAGQMSINAASSVGGVSGQWIMENLRAPVPANWIVS
jgi:hypothetical protein